MSGGIFQFEQKILFKHCDPAGIVFYPRYFEIINDCVEAFFDAMGHPFSELLKTHAVPTARIETEFPRPSRHGDVLSLALCLTRLGGASAGILINAHCGDEVRMVCRSVLVHVGGDGRSLPWPDDLRGALRGYVKEDAG